MDNAMENVGSDETSDRLQMIRVKFLRLAHRLGLSPSHVSVAHVLFRLILVDQQLRGRHADASSSNHAWKMAEQLELAGEEPLDFSCTIMVLGKSGVGKSATINSIFDQVMFSTDAFQLETKEVKEVVGTVHGIKVRVIDTPGLLPSWSDQQRNGKILHSVKRFIIKSPPDIVLYFDRLNGHARDSDDKLLLQTITNTFGPSIWMNAFVVLTHAASALPEGPNGVATDYDTYVTERSRAVQRADRRAAKEMLLMNISVALAENLSTCRTDRAGRRVLPNGQAWKPNLLMLSFASKILGEANDLLESQNGASKRPYSSRPRLLPSPLFLTSLLRSKANLKKPHDQYDIDDESLDDNLDELLNSDDELEYDELPPFKTLTRSQVAELSKSERKAYFEELDYREKLYMKKQLQDVKQWRMMKKKEAAAKDFNSDQSNKLVEESGGEAHETLTVINVPVPASFDSDDPVNRYRFFHIWNKLNVEPVLYSDSWVHDDGYAGVNMNKSFEVINKVPMSFTGQIKKDKNETLFKMEVAGSAKHGKTKETTICFNLQSIGSDIAYTIRSDTTFSNLKRNKATAGLSVTRAGGALIAGLKVEDQIIVSRRAQVVMQGGATAHGGNVAYGGSLEATLRDKNFH